MSVFRNAVFVAALAGLVSGLVLAALQSFTTVPLILQAEKFEDAAPAQQAAAMPGMAGHDIQAPAGQAPAAGAPESEEGGWSPADGFERFAFNVMASAVSGIGFALLLVAVSEMLGGMAGWRQGLIWGFAGFAVFTLAPGLGLPPNMPGMPAAPVLDRQIWWIATAAATGIGLWLIVFRGTLVLSALGLGLIVAPHLFGAPLPPTFETGVPEALQHSFIVAVTLTNLVFWLVLGAMTGAVRTRFAGRPEDAPVGRFA
ncbi:MAG: CbtA family protein [Methylobacterium mesophilicum]|nr:CbtA family protein [Methylobacterium mesophilicum]